MDENDNVRYTRFFEGLSTHLQILKELRSVYDEQMAFNFNVTNSFVIPDENKISTILAFLLDPNSSHGQKAVFLRVFCNDFFPHDYKQLDGLINKKVEVRREQRTDEDRRIDIVITFGDGQFLIGIENKTGAGDQKNQLCDYSRYLKETSKDNYRLLYLNPRGYDPSEYSISTLQRDALGSKLQTISYEEHIILLLAHFMTVCKSDKVTAFLRDFQQYLRIRFRNEEPYNMGDSNEVKAFILKAKDNITVAFQVAANIVAVQEALYEPVEEELNRWKLSSGIANPPKIKCRTLSVVRKEAWGRLITLEHEEEGWNLAVEFQRKELEDLFIIIEGRTDGPVDKDLLESILTVLEYELLGLTRPGRPNIHRHYEANANTRIAPWLDMAPKGDGSYSEFTKKIIDWHDKALSVIESKLKDPKKDTA